MSFDHERIASEPPDQNDKNYWLNVDDIDRISWDFKVPWENVESFMHTSSQVDLHSDKQKFKGGMYSVLARINAFGLSVYAGLNMPALLSPYYILSGQYCISLRKFTGPEKEEFTLVKLKSGEKIYHLELSDGGVPQVLVDHGEQGVVGLASLQRDKESMVGADGCFTLHCELKAVPLPPSVLPGHDSRAVTGMMGLENLGATCYLNALLQMLYHVNAFRTAVFQTPFEGEELASSITLAMQSVFSQLHTRPRGVVSTSDLTRAFGWDSLEAFQQQDVQEMLRVLLDKMEERMRGKGAVDGVVKSLFAGKIKSYIRCVNIDYESAREEEFYDIQLDVKGCRDVYESFKKYSEKEMLKGENQYDAGEDERGNKRGKQDAEKGVVFTELPPVLTIHLKRFEFDMQKMSFAKIHDHYEFPLRLELDQFVEPAGPPHGEAADRAPKNTFVLHSVLIHAGDVFGGHYYAYIRPSVGDFWASVTEVDRDVEAAVDAGPGRGSRAGVGGEWFKFDDDIVTKVDWRQAVEGSFGSGGDVFAKRTYHSAYMLVYMREAEAARTMAEVPIPEALAARLSEEHSRRVDAERKREALALFTHVNFLIKEDLDDFSNYSAEYDFFDPSDVRILSILRKSTLPGYLTAFADLLGVRVDQIRLWTILRADQRDVWRISEVLSVDELGDAHVPLHDRGGSVIIYVEVRPRMKDTVLDEKLQELDVSHRDWLERCRDAVADAVGDVGYDRMAGCGPGRGYMQAMKYIREGPVKAELLDEIRVMNLFLRECLLTCKSYKEDAECPPLMIILKYMNLNAEGELVLPVVMRTVMVQSINNMKLTLDDLRQHSFKVMCADLVRRQSVGEISIEETQALLKVWSRYDLFKMNCPVDWMPLPEGEYKYPVADVDTSTLSNGDIFCLMPLLPSECGDEDSDVSDAEVDSSFYLDMMVQYMRSLVLVFCMTVKSHSKLHVPQKDFLNRRTGLWCRARELLQLGGGDEMEVTEVLPECGTPISGHEDLKLASLVQLVDARLSFGDPSRLRLGTEREDKGRNGNKSFMTVQDDFFRRGMHTNADYLLVEALPFPRQQQQQQLTVQGSAEEGGGAHACKYYEVYLMGAALRGVRKEWLDREVYPRADELYRQQVLGGGAIDVFQLQRVYQQLPWPESTAPIPDEFITPGKCYMRMQLDTAGRGALTVHDVVQVFRQHMGIPLESQDRIPGPVSSSVFGRKRSAEGAGLTDGGRAAEGEGEESSVEPREALVTTPPPPAVRTKREELGELLRCAERAADEDRVVLRVLLFSVRAGRIARIFHPEDPMEFIAQSWVEDGVFNLSSRTTSIAPLCAQLMSSTEMTFITAAHPTVRSIPVSVFSFEFSMQTAKTRIRLSETVAGPLLSYVREDDTYESLVERLHAAVGEHSNTDWDKLRLAVVSRDNVPHFIAKAVPPSPRAAVSASASAAVEFLGVKEENEDRGEQALEGADEGAESAVWHMFQKYYPVYVQLAASWDRTPIDCASLPQLGLQHPVETAVRGPFATRGVRRVNSGVKIN